MGFFASLMEKANEQAPKKIGELVAKTERIVAIATDKTILTCKEAADKYNKSYTETKRLLEEQHNTAKEIKPKIVKASPFEKFLKAYNETRKPLENQNNAAEVVNPKVDEDDQYNSLLHKSESEFEHVLLERDKLLLKYKGYLTEDETDNILMENQSIRHELEQIRPELEKLRSKTKTYLKKRQDIVSQRIRKCYPNIKVEEEAYKDIVSLTDSGLNAVERKLGLLQHNISNVKFRDTVAGTRVRELDYDHDGRIYAAIEGNMVTIYRVGNKGTQPEDIKWITSHCR